MFLKRHCNWDLVRHIGQLRLLECAKKYLWSCADRKCTRIIINTALAFKPVKPHLDSSEQKERETERRGVGHCIRKMRKK